METRLQNKLLIAEQVDLTKYPDTIENKLEENTQFTYGDLHGNVLSAINFAIRCRVLKISADNYAQIVQIYKSINTQRNPKLAASDINKFYNILKDSVDNSKDITLRFIGDVLADRGGSNPYAGGFVPFGNDILTLLFFQCLKVHEVKTEILFSNHDAAFFKFIASYINGKFKFDKFPEIVGLDKNTSNTLYYLALFLKNKVVDFSLIEKLFVNYKHNIKIVSYSHDVSSNSICFFTHAPVGFETIEELSKYYGVEYKISDVTSIKNTIDQINAKFALSLVDNSIANSFPESSKMESTEEIYKSYGGCGQWPVSKNHPIYRTVWNRARALRNVQYNQFKDIAIKQIEQLADGTRVYWQHGHDGIYEKQLFENYSNLDSPLGKYSLNGERKFSKIIGISGPSQDTVYKKQLLVYEVLRFKKVLLNNKDFDASDLRIILQLCDDILKQPFNDKFNRITYKFFKNINIDTNNISVSDLYDKWTNSICHLNPEIYQLANKAKDEFSFSTNHSPIFSYDATHALVYGKNKNRRAQHAMPGPLVEEKEFGKQALRDWNGLEKKYYINIRDDKTGKTTKTLLKDLVYNLDEIARIKYGIAEELKEIDEKHFSVRSFKNCQGLQSFFKDYLFYKVDDPAKREQLAYLAVSHFYQAGLPNATNSLFYGDAFRPDSLLIKMPEKHSVVFDPAVNGVGITELGIADKADIPIGNLDTKKINKNLLGFKAKTSFLIDDSGKLNIGLNNLSINIYDDLVKDYVFNKGFVSDYLKQFKGHNQDIKKSFLDKLYNRLLDLNLRKDTKSKRELIQLYYIYDKFKNLDLNKEFKIIAFDKYIKEIMKNLSGSSFVLDEFENFQLEHEIKKLENECEKARFSNSLLGERAYYILNAIHREKSYIPKKDFPLLQKYTQQTTELLKNPGAINDYTNTLSEVSKVVKSNQKRNWGAALLCGGLALLSAAILTTSICLLVASHGAASPVVFAGMKLGFDVLSMAATFSTVATVGFGYGSFFSFRKTNLIDKSGRDFETSVNVFNGL